MISGAGSARIQHGVRHHLALRSPRGHDHDSDDPGCLDIPRGGPRRARQAARLRSVLRGPRTACGSIPAPGPRRRRERPRRRRSMGPDDQRAAGRHDPVRPSSRRRRPSARRAHCRRRPRHAVDLPLPPNCGSCSLSTADGRPSTMPTGWPSCSPRRCCLPAPDICLHRLTSQPLPWFQAAQHDRRATSGVNAWAASPGGFDGGQVGVKGGGRLGGGPAVADRQHRGVDDIAGPSPSNGTDRRGMIAQAQHKLGTRSEKRRNQPGTTGKAPGHEATQPRPAPRTLGRRAVREMAADRPTGDLLSARGSPGLRQVHPASRRMSDLRLRSRQSDRGRHWRNRAG
jgi:hypothetical protein